MIFDAFARRLRGRDSWRREQEHVARLVVERPQDTLSFADVLDLELERRGYDLAVHSVRSSLLDLVCGLVHDDALQLAVQLASRPGPELPELGDTSRRRARGARQIAATRPAAEIWPLLAGSDGLRRRDPEFDLLLLHELVVRGERPPTSAWWVAEWAVATGHPLGLLPLELLPIEAGLPRWLPRHGPLVGAGSVTLPPAPPRGAVPLGDILNGLGPVLPVDHQRIGATFGDWVRHSNGRVAVAGYRPGTTFPYAAPPCLSRGMAACRLTPAAAVERLFSCVAAHGAHAAGPGGAEARLRTWEAISGIVDGDWPAPIDQLAEAADRIRWTLVEPSGPWFERIAWDVWLIGANGERIVVVAATDAA